MQEGKTTKKSMPVHITISFLESKGKENNLESCQKKMTAYLYKKYYYTDSGSIFKSHGGQKEET